MLTCGCNLAAAAVASEVNDGPHNGHRQRQARIRERIERHVTVKYLLRLASLEVHHAGAAIAPLHPRLGQPLARGNVVYHVS